MTALFKRLQAPSFCSYQLQQPLSLPGPKKHEFLLGSMSLRTFSLLFQMHYYQNKANGAAGALSRFPQQDNGEAAKF